MRFSAYRTLVLALAFCLLNISQSTPDMHSDNPEERRQALQQRKEEAVSLRVFDMTSADFSSWVGDGNVWLIEFYTPWCRYCQSFSNSYATIAATFHSSPREGIRVAKVECSVEKALKARFGITSYPSFFIVDGWSVYKFENSRTEAKLMDFARGGYKKEDPIPFWASPMGPMGLLQGAMIYFGTRMMDFFDWVQGAYGVSPILAGMVICGLGIFGGMVSIVLLTIVTTPRAKHD